ncbi:SOS response-associated peptidase [Roseococcus sp. SYP-B2431]|uniref:SOS response-associated peptidase n=1 Tax=Roseococcus sp. SYP-B2431 TaxID=2496640 RepID=UPI001040A222|nr:SOS response-associated peptidase [Roseococcus sp. SYP-B2431]TCI00776.1 SOS response-associated peptidase [Roseococcus sp. SYP-B2431]
MARPLMFLLCSIPSVEPASSQDGLWKLGITDRSTVGARWEKDQPMLPAVAENDFDLGDGRPGSLGLVIRRHPETGERRMDKLIWGLLPHDTLDPRSAPRPTHARAETIATHPVFTGAFRARRAIVPATEFYLRNTQGARGPRRYAVARRDGEPLGLAALWEGFRWPNGRVTRSYCIVTVAANEMIAPFHDRMPLVLEKADVGVWLGEVAGDPAALLRPPAADVLGCRSLGRG